MLENELNRLPDKIGNWTRSNINSSLYTIGNLCAEINIKKNIVSFGEYKPCGFNIRSIKFEDKNDLINMLLEISTVNDIKNYEL